MVTRNLKTGLFGFAALALAALAPSVASAGFGAIACDMYGSGACGASSGFSSLGAAQVRALMACRAGGYACYLYRWEQNMCIRGPNGSYACN